MTLIAFKITKQRNDRGKATVLRLKFGNTSSEIYRRRKLAKQL